MTLLTTDRVGRLRAHKVVGADGTQRPPAHQTPLERFLEPCILLILTDGPLHGYALKEHCDIECLMLEPIDVGTLYKTLRRMETEGWLTSEWADGQGPRRRVYNLTPLGLQVLHSWASGLAKHKNTIELFLAGYEGRFGPKDVKCSDC